MVFYIRTAVATGNALGPEYGCLALPVHESYARELVIGLVGPDWPLPGIAALS